MIANSLSVMCKAMAPVLGNHLWQSTIFAMATGFLTLLLRNNHARTRYLLWLTASVKFLLPFSLLAGVGSRIAWLRSSERANSGLYVAIDQLGQPFSFSRVSFISETTPPTHPVGLLDLLPPLLVAVWLCGIALVVFAWYMRWRRISTVLQKATPLRGGREMESLRRIERAAGISKQIEMRGARASLEPGIFGILRPILVWPQGISERLDDAHMDAVLAHELSHVQRRDNLSVSLHLLVEAIFWFHPIVWWIGARLLQERERACDEQVVDMGTDRQVYAESILKICEFCVGSPLDFVSGVTGADLQKRIVNIMAKNEVRNLDLGRKLLLSTAGLVAVSVPVLFGLLNATQSLAQSQSEISGLIPPIYEAISVKPSSFKRNRTEGTSLEMMFTGDTFHATDATLQTLIEAAYRVEDNQISGAPNWFNSEEFDIYAKWDKSVMDALKELSQDQLVIERRHMLQELLTDRFRLTLHLETKHLPMYELVVAQSGLKLHEATPGDTYPKGIKDMYGKGHAGLMSVRMGQLVAQGTPVSLLVRELSHELSRQSGGSIIEDKTGLQGNYDFTLQWAPEESPASLLKAVEEQLGLKLEPQNGPGQILVIDRAEKPSEN